MEDNKRLLAHMEDLAAKAKKTGMAHSKFLTASEAAVVGQAYANRQDISLALVGGFAQAERRVAVFTQPSWGSCNPTEVIAGLCLQCRAQDIIRHKDVLGAVLGLGVSREVLGDIFVEPGRVSLVCLASIAGFLQAEIDKVGRVGVAASFLPIAHLPDAAVVLQEKQMTVASLRLDAVIAAAFSCSRSDASDWIAGGRVQLAHRECTNASKPVRLGEILSIRGKGRAKLLAVDGLSRKGRQRIVLGFYGG